MDTPHIWGDDSSLPSLPPEPAPALDHSADSPLGVLVDTSLFRDKSVEDTVITFVITPPYAHFPEVIRNALLIHFFTSIHVWIPQILYI